MLPMPLTADVGAIVREYQAKNQHIVYKKIENKGIAANTNAAAALASGEYLALADHDDILAPHALYAMGRAILDLRAAGRTGRFCLQRRSSFQQEHPAAAWWPTSSRTTRRTTCSAATTSAIWPCSGGPVYEAVGGERPECDGSQDHDLFLRLIEKAGRRGPSAPGALLLAGPRGLHLRRHRRQALCGQGGQKGAGRPPDPHGPGGHRHRWIVPQHLPRLVEN